MSHLFMVLARGVAKRGQVTLFIIIALVIVVGIALFFVLKNNYSNTNILNKKVQPIYDSYLSCLESTLDEGIKILGYQGGYIQLPEFVAGSNYRPTSSQLDFFGQPIAYWYFISGNNLVKEQVPTKKDMEKELENYLSQRLDGCNFKEYSQTGYDVYVGKGNVSVSITDSKVEAFIENSFNIYTEEETYILENHEISVESKLGEIYSLAVNTYNHEIENNFLEDYALDALWTSSPVVGVNYSCEPLVFTDEKIIENLLNSLSANIGSIKLKGDYYTLSNDLNKYFVVDTGDFVKENVIFRYSPNWTTKVDIEGDRIVNPVGLEKGLEMLGFCYAPYHLVYDIDFPVLIQFFDEDFIFQFPVVVVIQDNELLNLSRSNMNQNLNDEVCNNLNGNLKVYTYNYDIEPVEARLQFKCISSLCELGNTLIDGMDSSFEGPAPSCVNGKVIASSDGYLPTEKIVNTLDEQPVNLLMKKYYTLNLNLNSEDLSVISFEGKDYSTVVNYPAEKVVKLVEGDYNISVTSYANTNIELSDTPKEICVDSPNDATAANLFGLTSEKCYAVENPVTEINRAVVGGGSLDNWYITETELGQGNTFNFVVENFGAPTSLEDLQQNYLLLETSKLNVRIN